MKTTFRNLGKGAKRDIRDQREMWGRREFMFVLFLGWNDWRMCMKTLKRKDAFSMSMRDDGKSMMQVQWWEGETVTIRDFSFFCAVGSQVICKQ